MQSSSRVCVSRAASLLGLAALSVLGLAAARPAVAQGYTYTTITSADLGTPNLPNPNSSGLGITNAGVVVGQVTVGPSIYGANPNYALTEGYQYDTNTWAATLLNYQAANDGNGFSAVSGDGSQILGGYGDFSISYFTDSGGHISALPDPYALTGSDPNTGFAAYYGINSSATTVGSFITPDGTAYQGFVRGADGTLTTFSDPNDDIGFTFADGINASGTTAGYYVTSANFDYTGFLRSADGTFTDFTVPGATDTYLLGLSDNGNLFGQYNVLNADGSGSIYNFTDVGGVLDTNVDIPGARFTDITGINDAGQISGYYGDFNHNDFSFYGNFNPVPEASSVVSFGLLLAFGLGGAVVAARRKKAPAAC